MRMVMVAFLVPAEVDGGGFADFTVRFNPSGNSPPIGGEVVVNCPALGVIMGVRYGEPN